MSNGHQVSIFPGSQVGVCFQVRLGDTRLDKKPGIEKVSRLGPSPGSAMLLHGCLTFPFHRLGWSSRLSTKEPVRGFPRSGHFCPVRAISRSRGLVVAAVPSHVKELDFADPRCPGQLEDGGAPQPYMFQVCLACVLDSCSIFQVRKLVPG